jgi:hypothetical protein
MARSPKPTRTSAANQASHTGNSAEEATALQTLSGDGLPQEALAQILTAEDIYLSPQVLAAMTGLDEKWFAGAREGQKEVDGPPFRKLGTAKSSPVRYNLADVRKWWAQFPKQVTTHGKVSTFRSAGDFFKDASPDSQWLFADIDGEPVDIVLALQSGAFAGIDQPDVAWLTFPEWIARAWRCDRMHREISALLGPLKAAAFANLELRTFDFETRNAPVSDRRRIDDPPRIHQPDS